MGRRSQDHLLKLAVIPARHHRLVPISFLGIIVGLEGYCGVGHDGIVLHQVPQQGEKGVRVGEVHLHHPGSVVHGCLHRTGHVLYPELRDGQLPLDALVGLQGKAAVGIEVLDEAGRGKKHGRHQDHHYSLEGCKFLYVALGSRHPSV